MIIDPETSEICKKINKIMNEHNLSLERKLYIYMQFSAKNCLLNKISKEDFIYLISLVYDDLEEEGNILGYI